MSDSIPGAPRGRGAAANPPNRFDPLPRVRDDDADPDEAPAPGTRFTAERTRSIIATNDSPDVGLEATVNPYRGCEHGCAYCYARHTHEYLGLSAGLDFETRIRVKENAPELLRRELSSPRWKPKVIDLSGVTDAYQPVERRLRLTRRCVEVLAAFRNPVIVITKNRLVVRDADLLSELARHRAAAVVLSITTLDAALQRRLEPRASSPRNRLDAIAALRRAGIPAGVNVAPVIPGLTDHEIPRILEEARSAGAEFADTVPVRLPYGVAPLFEAWLERHYPDRKQKVLGRIRALRDGRLNDPDFHTRMRGKGIFARQIEALFEGACRRLGYGPPPALSAASFRRDGGAQPEWTFNAIKEI
jgi:DNA repair photolyase